MQGKNEEVDAGMMTFLLKIIAGAALMLLAGIFAILFEGLDRVIHAKMQRRVGPPVLQAFYDILKLLGKENITPRSGNKWLFNMSPWFSVAVTLLVFMYIPIGSLPAILGTSGGLILIIYLLSLSAVMMAIGGFASGNPIANVGAQREIILMMSYELPLAVVVTTMAWLAYTLGLPGQPFSLETFVATSVWGVVGKAGIFGLVLLMVSLILVIPGETGKGIMDITEAKTEILEGLTIEYSGTNLAMIHLAISLRALAMSGVIVGLFIPWSLGASIGFSGGLLFAIDFVWFWVKTFAVAILGVTLIRTAYGRFKIWQASEFYWFKTAGLALAGMILLSLDVLL